MPPTYRRQRQIIAGVAVALVAVGVGVPVAGHLFQPGVARGPARPSSYQVTYQVVTDTGNGKVRRWELLTVQRPFESSSVDYPSRPGLGSRPDSGTMFTKLTLFSVDTSGAHPVAGREPGPGGDDQDLITQLPDLESRGLALDLGTGSTISGRTCHLYRFSGPPSGALPALAGGPRADHDDLCLDGQGLVLGEDWTYHGRVVLHRRAVSVRVGAVTPPLAPPADRQVSGATAPLAAPAPSGAPSFLPVPPTPDGFHPAGEDAFLDPDPQQPGAILASSVTWAFTHGPDVISVEAGSSPPGDLPWSSEPTRTTAVDLAGLGQAQTALRSDGAEIRVDFGDGQWVRIRGTVPVSGLVRYAMTIPARKAS